MHDARRALPALATVLASLVLLSGCSSDEPEPSASGPSESSAATTIKQGAIKLTPPANEKVVGRRSGEGGSARVQVPRGGEVIVYIVCDGTAPVTASIDAASRDDDLRATCDRVISRRQYYTDRDEPMTVRIVASDTVSWQALVTRRPT